jgi:transcriptional regulator with XRE-family HTH domain
MNKKIKKFTFGKLSQKKLNERSVFEDYLKISDEIYKFRTEKKISQKKLAQLAGTTQRIISQIENSEINMGVNLFLRISKVLDIPFKYGDFSEREKFYAEIRYNKLNDEKFLECSDSAESYNFNFIKSDNMSLKFN